MRILKLWNSKYFDESMIIFFFNSVIYNCLYYSIRHCLVPPKRPTLSQICEEELDNGEFYYSKIL